MSTLPCKLLSSLFFHWKFAGPEVFCPLLLTALDFANCWTRGKPFGRSPCEESDPERLNHNAEVVGNALVTVACAILTLVLVKRVHRIRFV